MQFGRLHMQLSYSWLNSFFRTKNQWSTIVQSIYSSKLKGLHKQVDKNKLNVIGGLFMQLSYRRLNSLVSRNLQWSTIHEFIKIDRLAMKRLNKNQINGIERLYMQLLYAN